MTSIKISSLSTSNSLNDGALEYVVIVQDGTNKKISFADIFANVKSDLIVNPGNGAVDLIVNGQTKNNLLKTYSTINRIGVGLDLESPESLLHVAGDLRIGSNATNKPGNLITSREILNITTAPEITTQTINTSYSTTVLKTVVGSKSSGVLLQLAAPGTDGILKVITYGEKDSSISSSVSYQLETTNIMNAATVTFTKLGNSVILYSYNSKWIIIGYNGVSIT